MVYLSNTDFKVAQDCPTKLFYKKLGYPSAKTEDPYLAMLAPGGFMIKAMAARLETTGE